MSVQRNEDSELVQLITDAEFQPQNRLVQFVAASETKTKRRRVWRVVHDLVACVTVAVTSFALTQPGCAMKLWDHASSHAGAGCLFAAYRLYERSARRDPNLPDSVAEFKTQVTHSTKEGVVAGLASAVMAAV